MNAYSKECIGSYSSLSKSTKIPPMKGSYRPIVLSTTSTSLYRDDAPSLQKKMCKLLLEIEANTESTNN